MKRITIRLKRLDARAIVPRYAHSDDWGDLAADLFTIETAELQPQQVRQFRTGIALEPPDGYGALVHDRSGLAVHGITTLAGVIDPAYRGEILVVLANVGTERVLISAGDRIAQLRVVQRIEAEFSIVDELSVTTRHDKGFGSTGR
jgi:dUTP pyrophosphatase